MKLRTQFKEDWTKSFYRLVYLLVNNKERKKPTEIPTLKSIKNGHLKSV